MKGFFACERGAAFIEFAVCLPLIVLLFLGGVEVSRYLFIVKKLQGAVNAETNIITSTNPTATTLTQADMDSIVNATFQEMMKPYDVTQNGIMVITDIYADPHAAGNKKDVPIVQWRYCGGGLSFNSKTNKFTGSYSKFGAVGAKADLSSLIVTSAGGAAQPFTLSSGDEILLAEVTYNFAPLIENPITGGFIKKKPIYFVSLSVPRFSHLNEVVGTKGPTGVLVKSNCP